MTFALNKKLGGALSLRITISIIFMAFATYWGYWLIEDEQKYYNWNTYRISQKLNHK